MLSVHCRCENGFDLQYKDLITFVYGLVKESEIGLVDWKHRTATWLVSRLGEPTSLNEAWPPANSSHRLSDEQSRIGHVGALNVIMSQMATPATVVHEIVRSSKLALGSSFSNLPPVNPSQGDHARRDDDGISAQYDLVPGATVGNVLTSLCVIFLSALQARDDYEYKRLRDVLRRCDELPYQFKREDFAVFRCLEMVALAGQSRASERLSVQEVVSIPQWTELADSVMHDSDQLHRPNDKELESPAPCMAYPLLILLSAIGHIRRPDAAELVPEVVDFALDQIKYLETCAEVDGRIDLLHQSMHHISYYRYFVMHILGIRTVTSYPNEDRWRKLVPLLAKDGEDLCNIDFWLEGASTAYEEAVSSIEKALSLVPPTNVTRRDYYNLTSENLENEMDLRLEMLKRVIEMDRTLTEATERLIDDVQKEAGSHLDERVARVNEELELRLAQETDKVHEELRGISMRVIEIIGVFLAIVAFLGTTVISGTAGDLELGERLLVLLSGGLISILYFLLLKVIVLRSGSKSYRKEPKNGRREDK